MKNGTKELIMETALKLFSEKGYDAVSVKDISDELNLSKSALYKHYKNKRDIFDSILERMTQEDAKRAAQFALPETESVSFDEGKRLKLESFAQYTLSQYKYWTEDAFAAPFRRLLTLEQYRSDEMKKLFRQYLGEGPLDYTEHLLTSITGEHRKAVMLALEFYSPMFMLYAVYDGDDGLMRPFLYERLRLYIELFIKKITEKEHYYHELSTK